MSEPGPKPWRRKRYERGFSYHWRKPEPVEIVFIQPEQARQYVTELREAKHEHLHGKPRPAGPATAGGLAGSQGTA